MNKRSDMSGFTLMEIIVVIVVLGIIATVALRSMEAPLKTARVVQTMREMDQLASAIAGNPDLYGSGARTDFGYVGDIGSMPASLDELVTGNGFATWDGPYISTNFGADDFKLDAWGREYIYGGGAVLISTGGGSDTLVKNVASSVSDLLNNSVTGFVADAAGNPPGDSAAGVLVSITYPDGVGSVKDSAMTVSATGEFTFAGTIPIGNHRIQGVYPATNDTAAGWVSVMPGSTCHTNLRFPGPLWGVSGGTGGGGTPGGPLEYVPGSASCPGGANEDIRFQVHNNGASGVNVTWVVVSFQQTPAAYYEVVRWGNQTKFNSTNPRAAAGDTAVFTSTASLALYATEEIRLNNFRDAQFGSASQVDMSGLDITVTFSDGSVVVFSSGT